MTEQQISLHALHEDGAPIDDPAAVVDPTQISSWGNRPILMFGMPDGANTLVELLILVRILGLQIRGASALECAAVLVIKPSQKKTSSARRSKDRGLQDVQTRFGSRAEDQQRQPHRLQSRRH